MIIVVVFVGQSQRNVLPWSLLLSKCQQNIVNGCKSNVFYPIFQTDALQKCVRMFKKAHSLRFCHRHISDSRLRLYLISQRRHTLFADSRLRLYLISQRRHSLLQTPASDSISYLSEDTLFCRLPPQTLSHISAKTHSFCRLPPQTLSHISAKTHSFCRLQPQSINLFADSSLSR